MASSLYNLALDFSKELNYTKAIMARQGDKGITVTVKPFLNGLQMDTSGGTFTLKGTTPSNRYVDSIATSVTSEEVTFSLDGTFMSEAGYYKHCYVEYRKGNQILTTQDIIFFSLGVSDISQGQADEYVSQLEELIRKYNETFDAFMAEIKGRVDSLNQQITDLTGQAKTLQDKLDALKEEISKLGNLQVMYSNSIDFGEYDYSGRANLAPNLDFSKFSGNGITMTEPLACFKDHETYLELNSSDPSAVNISRNIYVPNCSALLPNNTYIMTVPIMINADFDDFRTAFILKTRDGTALGKVNPPRENVGTWQNVTQVFTVPSNLKFDNTYLQLWQPIEGNGKIYIGYDIKIEKVNSTSDTATPYQPNLLDAPYYLSKVALGDNLVTNARFPIKTSSNPISGFDISEELIIGETYTVSLKGTKPANKEFQLYYGDAGNFQAALQPAEGLKDVWSATFTAKNTTGTTNLLRVALWQMPTTVTNGDVQIDWLKIEKGDTRTPNIDQYKYRGIGMRDSNNPKDYVWDIAPEYVEDNLATDVKISEITGKANNYTDGKVSEINSQLTASINEVDTTAKDAQTKANANATAIEDTKSRVDEIENNLYVLGEWKTLPLENGYTGADGTTPQYRVNLVNGHRNVVFNGAISTTAGTLPSQGQQHNASTLPTELIPSGTKMGLGATSLFTTSCRLAVTGKGTLYIGNDSGKDVKYCYLDLFSYWLD
ncbi:BppU family phage baseplate upper protein [Enterococcus lactis]|uniref:BppU family phage baseplate upper protein n=1 Tax=Enterococcus lactis TaxID=357441 RepID=UPI0022E1B3D9|nr:BppU family phage baseplate upper protein [Enterococcus lactis]